MHNHKSNQDGGKFLRLFVVLFQLYLGTKRNNAANMKGDFKLAALVFDSVCFKG